LKLLRPPEKKEKCYDFSKGNCNRGASCKYSHE
jgi:hypothetical protein